MKIDETHVEDIDNLLLYPITDFIVKPSEFLVGEYHIRLEVKIDGDSSGTYGFHCHIENRNGNLFLTGIGRSKLKTPRETKATLEMNKLGDLVWPRQQVTKGLPENIAGALINPVVIFVMRPCFIVNTDAKNSIHLRVEMEITGVEFHYTKGLASTMITSGELTSCLNM